MVSSSIMVGRVIVDPDHAEIARHLLSAEDVLAHMDLVHDTKKEDHTLKYDEDYARKLQDEYVRDALRTIEDYRFAKSLAERDDDYVSNFFVDQSAMDYLHELLTEAQEPLVSEPLVPNNGVPDCSLIEFDPTVFGYQSVSPREAVVAAAEHRQASLAVAISAGLPGPSGLIPGSASTEPTLIGEGERVPSPAFSRSSTDPGDPNDIDNRDERDERDEKDCLYSDDEETDAQRKQIILVMDMIEMA
ncbi:hypothetical protein J132_02903 [Termitomyces sp. J132]|nr:hypothetical protein H2248_002409 [Termitomyces sp. 'cryptogamus']KNZ77963.1 hypothetical protein J132_02903 [Termitomyces sp. J132]